MPKIVPSAEARLVYQSDRGKRRPGTAFIIVFLALLALLGAAAVASGVLNLFSTSHYILLSLTPLITGIILLGYVAWFSVRLWRESSTHFVLELTDDMIHLKVYRYDGARLQASMRYFDMRFVEFYTPRDRETLLFHSKDDRIIEAPLWQMNRSPSEALKFLSRKGVQILTV